MRGLLLGMALIFMGCSTAPLAGLLDCISPGHARPTGADVGDARSPAIGPPIPPQPRDPLLGPPNDAPLTPGLAPPIPPVPPPTPAPGGPPAPDPVPPSSSTKLPLPARPAEAGEPFFAEPPPPAAR